MSRGTSTVVSLWLTLLLTGTPALAAACAAACVAPGRTAQGVAAAGCHESAADRRLTSATPDPCGSHDTIVERAARPQTTRDHLAPPDVMLPAVARDPAWHHLRSPSTTPGPAPPLAPSRPPDVLRL